MRCFLIRSTAKSGVGSPSSRRNSAAVATAWQPQSVPLFWRCVGKYIYINLYFTINMVAK